MINFLKIINFLGKHYSEEYTMHELSNILKIPYATFYRQVDMMTSSNCKILNIKEIGKSKVVKLNLNHPIIKSHLANSSFDEMQDFLQKNVLIKKLAHEICNKNLGNDHIILLFGSYAKNKETEKSDIDILVINKKGNNTLSLSTFELLYKKKVNPICLTKKEFQNMLIDKDENIAKQALKDHIILYNQEEFWGCFLDAIR